MTTCCTNFNDDNSDGQTDCDPRGDCAKALKHGGGAQSLKYTIKCRLCNKLPDATFLAKVAVVVQACCVSDAHNGAGAIRAPPPAPAKDHSCTVFSVPCTHVHHVKGQTPPYFTGSVKTVVRKYVWYEVWVAPSYYYGHSYYGR